MCFKLVSKENQNFFKSVKYVLFCLFITSLFSGCATTGKTIHANGDNYGLTVKSSYNGNLITINKNTECLNYKGRNFYFENELNMSKFQDNPEKYINIHPFNRSPKKIKSLKSDWGLKTNSSYNGDPIVVSEYTPTLYFLDRIYYFAHNEEVEAFKHDPLIFIAKYPANRIPKTISPLKSDYGEKTVCGSSGNQILIGPHTPALEYLGRVFYFSSLYEMQVFQQDPQAYVAKSFNKN
ncbi:MAG: hypothetical protein K9M56_05325 [Victivallales bacterium]|nr:hypothetical protein [Victivallales bacterium]